MNFYIQTRQQKGGSMAEKRKHGRPMSSHNVSVTPEFKKVPDIEKLGRVLLSVAINRAEAKDNGADVLSVNFPTMEDKGDAMT